MGPRTSGTPFRARYLSIHSENHSRRYLTDNAKSREDALVAPRCAAPSHH